ncbi:Cytochrome P450 3A24, partial [Orchesella cincta]
AGLVAFLVIYARWHYGTLEKLGIPVETPHFILGSNPNGHKIVYAQKDLERFHKYGAVYGVYEGRTPRVYVTDPEMIRRIMVKDFDHFHDRSLQDWGHEIFDNLLDFLPGEKWKTMRSGITPMFTSSRIRSGTKNFTSLTDKYIKKMRKEFKGTSMKFDMKEFTIPIVVEFICDHFLSVKLSDEGNIRENYIYKMVLEAIGEGQDASFAFVRKRGFWYSESNNMFYPAVFPFMLKFLPLFDQKGINKFINTLEEVVKARKANKVDTSNGKDFIDVMVSMFESLDSPEYKRLGINRITIQAQAFEMFIAGYDPILSTLSTLTYHFAMNQEIQEKLLEEVDENLNKIKDGTADLPYLTACVKEAIRLSPSFIELERLCMKDWTFNERDINVTIPKGTSFAFQPGQLIEIPKYSKILKNLDLNGADGKLMSDLEQNPLAQYSMNSFGHGPHNCPGSRMAIELIKAGMARMLQEFKFEKRSDTVVEIQEGLPFIVRYKPIYVDINIKMHIQKHAEQKNKVFHPFLA